MVTPFHPDGSVNVERFRELAAYLVDHGSDGLVVSGTTGEAPTLTDEEKLELFAAAVDAVGDRATIVASTGTYDTAHSVHLTEAAHELGVDGFLAITPYYNKPPQRAIVRHFAAIAAATDKPLVVYNIPSRVVVNIEPDTVAELAEIPNVAAVKQAHGDLDMRHEGLRADAEDTAASPRCAPDRLHMRHESARGSRPSPRSGSRSAYPTPCRTVHRNSGW